MAIRLRVVETRRSLGRADITMDDQPPEQAAKAVVQAHQEALLRGSPLIELPDGQIIVIEQGPLDTAIDVTLLDESGNEVRPINLSKRRAVRAARE